MVVTVEEESISDLIFRALPSRCLSGVDFSPNGFHVATASEDNSAKIWDLRQRKNIYTIPAHNNLLTHVKYEKSEGRRMMTMMMMMMMMMMMLMMMMIIDTMNAGW